MTQPENSRPAQSAFRAADPQEAADNDIPGTSYCTGKARTRQNGSVPNPNASEEQALKYEHLDLPECSEQELMREWCRAVTMLGLEESPAAQEWFYGRLKAIEAERRRRNAQRRR